VVQVSHLLSQEVFILRNRPIYAEVCQIQEFIESMGGSWFHIYQCGYLENFIVLRATVGPNCGQCAKSYRYVICLQYVLSLFLFLRVASITNNLWGCCQSRLCLMEPPRIISIIFSFNYLTFVLSTQYRVTVKRSTN
jgi:hypothetical protein